MPKFGTLKTAKSSKNVEQPEFSYFWVGLKNSIVNLEDSLAVSYQTKHILTRCPRNCAPWYLPKGSTHLYQHKNLHTNVYSFTHNCRNLEASKMSFSS